MKLWEQVRMREGWEGGSEVTDRSLDWVQSPRAHGKPGMIVCVSDPNTQQQEEEKKMQNSRKFTGPAACCRVKQQGNPVTSTSGGPLTTTESQREMRGRGRREGRGEEEEGKKFSGWQDGSH